MITDGRKQGSEVLSAKTGAAQVADTASGDEVLRTGEILVWKVGRASGS
ncbi:hypothetical protein [Streptomyces sp. NPDC086010]